MRTPFRNALRRLWPFGRKKLQITAHSFENPDRINLTPEEAARVRSNAEKLSPSVHINLSSEDAEIQRKKALEMKKS